MNAHLPQRSTAVGNHDIGWIRRHLPDDGSVEVADVTSAYACLGLWGPRARDILQPLTTADLSNAGMILRLARAIARCPIEEPGVACRS